MKGKDIWLRTSADIVGYVRRSRRAKGSNLLSTNKSLVDSAGLCFLVAVRSLLKFINMLPCYSDSGIHNPILELIQEFIYFYTMKKMRELTLLVSLLSLVAFLAASTGITVISHSCLYSGSESLIAGILSEKNANSQSCCITHTICSDKYQTAEEHGGCCSNQHQAENNLNSCCKYEYNIVKVNSFLPKVNKVSLPELITILANHPGLTVICSKENTISTSTRLEKYGGRSLTTIHHQLII